MRIELDRKLFAGVRIDNKLRDALEHCPPREKAFFDGSDPRYLTVLRAVEDSYVGKIVDAGLPAVQMDDLKRNILSLLNRLSTSRRSEDDVKVYALDEGEPPPLPPKEPSPYDRY
jgi:hypothetical protein